MADASVCRDCGTEIGARLLACPACSALVHVGDLQRLAAAAKAAETPTEALVHWREAFALLPHGSRQQQVIAAKIEGLVAEADRSPLPGRPKTKISWGKVAGGAGVVALFLAKFKFVILFLLTKGKLLLLGLTKMSTLLSMFVSFGFYWTVLGWKFAAGLILSIYVHEMGHVAMLVKLGVKASAPMFIPGLGAVVRLREHLPTAREDARVGLAGPVCGLGAAVAAWLLGMGFQSPLFLAIAKFGAWINLFNLTPVWQLDGSRAFRALTRWQRAVATGTVAVAFFCTTADVHGMLLLVLAVAIFRLFGKNAPAEPDPQALAEYVILIAGHSLLASLHVAM